MSDSTVMRKMAKKLVQEIVGGEPYEYYPIGRHIVVAPGVCGGRPTFKYTRIDVRHALSLLAAGRTVERVADSYQISVAGVREALALGMTAQLQLFLTDCKDGHSIHPKS